MPPPAMPPYEQTSTRRSASQPLVPRLEERAVDEVSVVREVPQSTSPVRPRGLLGLQLALVLGAWVYLCILHWGNDGLWYVGDAPIHAANGLFWRDYLSRPSLDPRGFALSYYARYPVINPTTHPPVFPLLESLAYTAFGASPYVAKGLVLGFALIGAMYLTAWLRRWVAVEAGFAGASLVLLPGVIVWSHAVMLNVPAMTLSLAALYHARRWLESPTRKELLRFLVLSVVATLTYYTAGVVFAVFLVWLVVGPLRSRSAVTNRRFTICLTVAMVLLGLLALGTASRLAPAHVFLTLPVPEKLGRLSNWTFYPSYMPRLFGVGMLVLAALGGIAGGVSRSWRREIALLLGWVVVIYVAFSVIRAREDRYILLMGAPLVVLGAIAQVEGTRRLGTVVGWPHGRVRAASAWATAACTLALAWPAARTHVPRVEGFRDVVTFLGRVAPDGVYFYDGRFQGAFTMSVQAGDPSYRRRVVRGDKLLYTSAMDRGWRLRQFVSSPQEVIETLRRRGGTRWIVVEIGDRAAPVQAARALREAVRGPDFELVRSFPVVGDGVRRVDVYRLLGPVLPVDELNLPFQILGDGVRYRARPIGPRGVR